LLAILLGVPIGLFAARSYGRKGDVAVRIGSFALLATPDFWLALMAIYLFFFKFRVAPAPIGQLGIDDPTPHRITGAAIWDSMLTANGGALRAALAHAAIPFLVYGFVLAAPIARLTRSSVHEVLNADYIRFGRSCGLPGRVLWRYAVRASLPPV